MEVKFLSIGVMIFLFRSLVLGSGMSLLDIFSGDLLLAFISVELWFLSREFKRFSSFY